MGIPTRKTHINIIKTIKRTPTDAEAYLRIYQNI